MKNIDEIFEALGSTPEFLFEPVTNVHQRGSSGDTPLHIVSSWGEKVAVETLILAGADVNARGEQGKTPLFSAVLSNSPELVKLLLDAGADPAIEDDDKNTALQFALLLHGPSGSGDTELIRILRSAFDVASG